MRRVTVALAATLALAGCGGSSQSPAQTAPRQLPHALANEWAQRADAIAAAISAGNGCTAQRLAERLRDDVIGAQGRLPARYRSTLLGAVNELADRIGCVPPAQTVTVSTQPTPAHPTPAPHPHPGPKPKPPGHGPGHGKGHG